jgi:NAD(P)-dependent dehydrogenase (short-subunit alcohol dehydrogenase family)
LPVSAYATAKFAVRGFTEGLHEDLRIHAPNVRATLVIPGQVQTSISTNTLRAHDRDPATMSTERLTQERARLQCGGTDVSRLDDEELRAQLAVWRQAFEATAMLTADQAATLILDGVRKDRRRIRLGFDAFSMDRATRLAPTRAYDIPQRWLAPVAVALAPVRGARILLMRRRARATAPPTAPADSPRAARSVLITGASTGIGAAAARHLDALGWQVFAGVRRAEDGQRLQQGTSERLRPVMLDVTDPHQVQAAIASIESDLHGRGLDGLVNNAGASWVGPLEVVPLDHWRRQFEVNVVGQVAVTKEALPLLRKATGRVVFISSLSGRVAEAYMGPYASSKFAIEGLAMSLRKEISPWGVRVAVIEPGVIDTPMWHKEPEFDTLESELPQDTLDLYRPYIEPVAGVVAKQLAAAAPLSAATDAIVHALTAPHPKHRYLVGPDAKVLGGLYRVLPDRVFARAEGVVWRVRLRARPGDAA